MITTTATLAEPDTPAMPPPRRSVLQPPGVDLAGLPWLAPRTLPGVAYRGRQVRNDSRRPVTVFVVTWRPSTPEDRCRAGAAEDDNLVIEAKRVTIPACGQKQFAHGTVVVAVLRGNAPAREIHAALDVVASKVFTGTSAGTGARTAVG